MAPISAEKIRINANASFEIIEDDTRVTDAGRQVTEIICRGIWQTATFLPLLQYLQNINLDHAYVINFQDMQLVPTLPELAAKRRFLLDQLVSNLPYTQLVAVNPPSDLQVSLRTNRIPIIEVDTALDPTVFGWQVMQALNANPLQTVLPRW